jgi:hypothetical protein
MTLQGATDSTGLEIGWPEGQSQRAAQQLSSVAQCREAWVAGQSPSQPGGAEALGKRTSELFQRRSPKRFGQYQSLVWVSQILPSVLCMAARSKCVCHMQQRSPGTSRLPAAECDTPHSQCLPFAARCRADSCLKVCGCMKAPAYEAPTPTLPRRGS